MKFSLYTDYGALNSKPVFDAFETSLKLAGHSVIHNEPYRFMDHYDNYDVAVIWSVLWNGRMAKNEQVWNVLRQINKPVIVLEVGGIKRGTTWKVGLNGINRDAYFSESGHNSSRADALGLRLKPWRTDGKYILICGQHDKSLQWKNMPAMSSWIMETIEEIQKHTDRPIIFRPHPRCPLPHIENEFKNVTRQNPVKISGTYDDFNMNFKNIWATVSWSSNPGIHSVIEGVPAFVGPSSLAYPVSMHSLELIETPSFPERRQWLNDYAHTEYTIEEIAQGIPLKYLTSKLY